MTTAELKSQWVALDMFTGEIRPLEDDEPRKRRRPDAAFIALVKLGGLQGQPLTDSLRGAYNKARKEIVQAERERDAEITLEKIAELIDGFEAWFKKYRRDRFNENCRRCPFPMETAKLWPEYRKAENDGNRGKEIADSWLRALKR